MPLTSAPMVHLPTNKALVHIYQAQTSSSAYFPSLKIPSLPSLENIRMRKSKLDPHPSPRIHPRMRTMARKTHHGALLHTEPSRSFLDETRSDCQPTLRESKTLPCKYHGALLHTEPSRSFIDETRSDCQPTLRENKTLPCKYLHGKWLYMHGKSFGVRCYTVKVAQQCYWWQRIFGRATR
jgi:hypothetical protein